MDSQNALLQGPWKAFTYNVPNPGGSTLRGYIIGCVEIDRIDLRLGHELQHLHHAGTARRDLLQFSLLDDHVAVLFVLVAFDQLIARDRLIFGLAVQDLFDARVVALMELIETDRLGARGGVKLNRNRDQAERDVTLPDTVPHGYASLLAMLYTRAPSARLMELTVSPIFFPSVPLTNPRTLWACQEVACMISVRVAPLARCSNARTAAVLLPGRTPSGFAFAAFLSALAALRAGVVFLGLAVVGALGLRP